jgi:tRNA (guanine10-N2)-dimethyltransferase
MEEILKSSEINWISDNFFYVDNLTDKQITNLVERSGSLRVLIAEYFTTIQRPLQDLLSCVDQNFDVSNCIGSFAVRVHKVGKQETEWNSQDLEREIGKLLQKKNNNLFVKLKDPANTFAVLVYSKEIIFGRLIKEQRAAAINWKSPKNLPYFRGGAMKSIVARLMVNLYSVEKSNYIMDPFCGHAGILIELADMGHYPIGLDLDGKILRQAQVNLRHINYDDRITLIMGDAINLPIRKKALSYMVTDPPYSIQTTTSGKEVGNLVIEWLNNVNKPIHITLAMPNDILDVLPDKWQVKKSVKDFVHRSLIRHIRLIYHG